MPLPGILAEERRGWGGGREKGDNNRHVTGAVFADAGFISWELGLLQRTITSRDSGSAVEPGDATPNADEASLTSDR